jgi:hypothetical protein
MNPKTMDEIKDIMRAAGDAHFKKYGSSQNFDDWYDGDMKEYKYTHDIIIDGTRYDWAVSDSHRKGRHLVTSRQLWVFGGKIPPDTKFSVGTRLKKSDLTHIVKTIHEDLIRKSNVAPGKQ